MAKKNKKVAESTLELMGIKSIEENFLVSPLGEHIYFFEIQPFNVAVIGKEEVLSKIEDLQSVLTSVNNMEILCISSAQSYEKNKAYLMERQNDTSMHPSVIEIAQLEAEYLDEISLTMSTSRDFYFVIKFRRNEFELENQKISQYLRIISDKGFIVKIAQKKQIKRAMAIYWEQNIYSSAYPDFDGEEFAQEGFCE